MDSALGRFAAIDFETADTGADSACAVAIVVVDGLEIIRTAHHLIRPPRERFQFTYIHGITWEQVKNQPVFGELWPEAVKLLDGVEFLAAHNASFDRNVLRQCCAVSGLPMPSIPFECTVRLARQTWNVFPTKLPDVCRHLNLPLVHHDAESDATACAKIVIAARQAQLAGWVPNRNTNPRPRRRSNQSHGSVTNRE